jgi:peptidylprolyl isomerase
MIGGVNMPFSNGDFLLVHYTAKVKETGEIIDTTIEEDAKNYGIYSSEREYEPILVIIGEGRIVKGLEEKLRELNEGEEVVFEVPPEKAYGARDPSKIKRIPLREFAKANIEPIPGKVVEINGLPAVVREVGGGRVLVDFNHPLAGKVIEYKAKVVKHVTDEYEKLKLLLKRRFKTKSIESYDIKLSDDKTSLTVKIPEKDMLLQDIQLAKRAFAREVFTYFPSIVKISFVEELEKQQKAEAKEEAPSSQTE